MSYDHLYNTRDRYGRFVRYGLKSQPGPRQPVVRNPGHERVLRKARYARAKQRYIHRTFRFSHEDFELLRYWANKNNESMTERLRTYMAWGFDLEEE